MPGARDILAELLYPVRNPTLLAAFVVFYLVIELIMNLLSGGPQFLVSALIFAAFALPALCVYLLDILESRARGAEPAPMSVEHLQWFGSAWSLLQLVHLAVVVYSAYLLGSLFGAAVFIAVLLAFAAVLPASLVILALTHSPLESVNPRAMGRLIRRCGAAYWIAPAYALAAMFAVSALSHSGVPDWLTEMAALFLLFAFYALTGGIVRPYRLHEQVAIHRPVEPGAAKLEGKRLQDRTAALNHAYGLASRGNRAGGLRHISEWIDREPDPEAAWPWFFEQMLKWDSTDAALQFGQQYLGWLLQRGDDVAAVKLIARCRLESEAFRPLPDDRELARQAAERCGREELVRSL
jgi:hypothetical protein